MNIVLLTHPPFLGSQSMPRFTWMLSQGMKERGHNVQVWSPKPGWYKYSPRGVAKKWLGYIDQFLVFPQTVRRQMRECPSNTLYVITDQALGPWVPLVSHRPHVIHCHDFLAQYSAKGLIAENPTSISGQIYQAFIREGYRKGRYFISVSHKTRNDLHDFVTGCSMSEVVYNGISPKFAPGNISEIRRALSIKTGINLENGFILHVGGNQWYKNRCGVLEIYNAWRSRGKALLPLLMVGKMPDKALSKQYHRSFYKYNIHFVPGLSDTHLQMAYAGASVFLFPSIAEGFGWPIAEAMASGCLVVTTNEAPMTEVAGDAAFLIPKRPSSSEEVRLWAKTAANVLERVLLLSDDRRQVAIEKGLIQSQKFNQERALDLVESLYERVMLLESQPAYA